VEALLGFFAETLRNINNGDWHDDSPAGWLGFEHLLSASRQSGEAEIDIDQSTMTSRVVDVAVGNR